MINKIYNWLSNPVVMIITWVLFLLSPALGLIRLQFLFNPKLSAFHISGLSTALFYAPFAMSTLVLIIMILWFREFSKGRLTIIHQRIFSFTSFLTLIFLIIAQYLLNLEYSSYPNYLYQHYGVTIAQLKSMSFVAALQVLIFLTFYVYRISYEPTTKFINTNLSKKGRGTFSFNNASLIVSVVGILSLFILSGSTALEIPVLSKSSYEGYEGKVGVDYKYIKLLSDYTPENVTVVHPPQGNVWPAIGNQPVLRYFLFPRTLVSGALINNQDFTKQLGDVYFVVIDPGGDRLWPIIDPKKKAIVFDEKNVILYRNLTTVFSNEVSKVYRIYF